MARRITRVPERTLTRSESAKVANIARLQTADWYEMTMAANQSGMHVKSLDRWVIKAKEANPRLTDDQAARLAQMMRTEHYRRMGRLSAQSRKLAREEVPGEREAGAA